jgi:hypothetical protein
MEELASRMVFAVPAALLLAAAELGARLGLRVHARHDEAHKSTISGIQGAMLGLLGLLLGFTFSMAMSRYDARRLLVVAEANAIGTTFLRAALLPDAHVAPVEDLLRRYVALRVEMKPTEDHHAQLAAFLKDSAEIQRQLWEHAVAAAREAPTVNSAAFVTALNQTIDTEAERVAASRARIPPTVWFLLLIVAGISCLTSSYAAGAQGARSALSSLIFPLLIAVVMTLIFDILDPHQGFIGVSQQSLADLQQSIAPRP